jgi:hypothetical protein
MPFLEARIRRLPGFPAAQRVLDMRARSGADTFVQNWAIGDSGLNCVSELNAAGLRRESIHGFVVNGVRHQNAIHCDADLPHMEKERRAAAEAASPISASPRTTNGQCPPSSSVNRFIVSAAARIID